MIQKPELLLPVGDYESCLAAIHNGADAIYIGVPHFNARGRTKDHSFSELKEMIDLCHLYNVKVHLAFNVLIFEEELERAAELIKNLIPLSPDAFIVQDLGLVKLIQSICPEQEIHASTQMTVTNHDAIELLEDLGIKRFVLGRENSLEEIKKIKAKTDKELEVFVHGALCVAYSGQCFTSESIGGRSANRGQCAQSCRFEYEMLVDGEKFDLKDRKHIVSPQDLAGIEQIPELANIGVHSLKVEGRLKGPDYVASTAHYYRKAVDQISFDYKKGVSDMALSYSRGFYSGWLNGVDHQRLVNGRYSSHRGIKVGKIIQIKNRNLEIESDQNLEPGMGIYIDGEKVQDGSSLYQVQKIGPQNYIIGLEKSFPVQNICKGDSLYLNSDPQLSKKWHKTITDRNLKKRIPLQIEIVAKLGHPLTLKYRDDHLQWRELKADSKLEKAQKTIDITVIEKEINSLSQSAYSIQELVIKNDDQCFISQKELKGLRQRMIEELNLSRTQRIPLIINDLRASELKHKPQDSEIGSPRLTILLRNKDQVDTLTKELSPDEWDQMAWVYLDFEFGRDYKEALELLEDYPCQVALATTRILKPGEYHNLNHLIRLNPDGFLVRNLGALQYLKEHAPEKSLIGDYSLNVSNSLTSEYLFGKSLQRLTPGLDLNGQQVMDLIRNSSQSDFELILHHYMPSFHMEHCVFAAFLSKGSSFKDCGKPCEKHKLELKDQFGNAHFITADQECRNTMFNARPQSSSQLVDQMVDLGVSLFRYEALGESDQELVFKVRNYLQFLAQELESDELTRNIGVHEKYGIGSGQLFGQDQYIDRKKELV
ncbi:MAG: collagenase [Bdellovibrio sp. CG12_big_fil_rev_8_21_14_0_65_39_13]|nr:MAG: collagenase [Bdellovibrio sp. CG22_combo_CG10-13_8_21_14_all_39_27]PIQ61094.1 MAG: collagenase [Bdellovibrio sp. CG12_big_fil_rev_8_21_14_0_65_39_13]PIR36862.1 MAG: collagenase [Bdellovibrio sp. CG11_big_fil_rev_8_21_14_0_20_39_38]